MRDFNKSKLYNVFDYYFDKGTWISRVRDLAAVTNANMTVMRSTYQFIYNLAIAL